MSLIFPIALVIMIIFMLIDPLSHRKFKKIPNLIFHIIGLILVILSLAFFIASEFKFSLLIYPGIFLIVASLFLILISYVQIKKHFLTAKGIVKIRLYKYIRHPMYSGIVLFFIGLILAVPSFYVFIYSLVAILFIIWQAYEEEKFLGNKFPEYKNYKKEIGMILPKFSINLLIIIYY